MKTFRSCFLGILVCGLPCAFAQTRAYSHLASLSESKAAAPALAAKYGQLPLIFEANQGQTDSRVRFTSRGYGYSLFLTDKEAVLALRKNPGHAMGRVAGFPHKPKRGLNGAPEAVKTDVVRMQLAGTAAGLKVSGEEQLPGTANYFIGNDPAKWHSNVSTYSKVKYAGVYPGVDLVYYGNQRQLEYDFVVAPGADPNQVKLRFAGASRLKLNADGDLMVMAKNGEIAFHKPVVYQLKSEQLSSAQQGAGSASERVVVEGRFVLLAGKTAKFSLGDYDRSRELVIDPTLAYSTYLGGSGGDEGIAIAVDNSGNAYVLGNTSSIDFPITKGSFQPVDNGAADHIPNVFVTKLNPSGTALVYSSYLGGSGLNGGNGDFGSGIAVDSSGNAYATGYTWSSDFPVTKGAFQPVNNAAATQGTNAFVTKLNSSGTTLVFSTYVGGSGVLQSAGFGYPGYGDSGNSIAADSLGNAYVTGSAYSVDFPVTKGAFQQVNNAAAIKASNAFAIKLNETGTALLYSTYLGGSGGRGGDTGSGIAIDAFGSAYLTGYAWSTDFPVTEGAFQAANNAAANKSINAFVTKLSSSGSSLLLSTYLGGSFGDAGAGIAVDTCGSAYVTGTAFSRDFPVTPGAFQTVFRGQGSGFISKLTPSGSSLLYSTFLGGSSYGTQASGIAVGLEGNAYVTGYSSSSDFPVTTGAFQAVNNAANNPSDPFPGAANDFMTELNPAGTALIYSTYLGGKGDNFGDGDHGQGVALDASGNVYLTGLAASLDFPVTKGAFQTVNHSPIPSSGTAFVAKFSMGSEIATTTSLMSDGNPQGAGVKVIFTAYVAPSTGSQVPTGTVGFAIAQAMLLTRRVHLWRGGIGWWRATPGTV
jgi:hypothetical protein